MGMGDGDRREVRPSAAPAEPHPVPPVSPPRGMTLRASAAVLGVLILLVLAVVAGRNWLVPAPSEADLDQLPALEGEAASLRQEALAAADRLVEEFPADADALYSKGLIYNRCGGRAVAVACWKKCLKRDSQFALAYFCLGWDALDHQQHEESVALLRKAVELDPKMSQAFLLLGQALVSLGRAEEAIGPLETHVRLAPRSSEGYFRLGQAYLQCQQYEKAQQYCLAALEIDPAHAAACDELATACAKQGRAEEAEKYRAKSAALKARDAQRAAPAKADDGDGRQWRAIAAYAHTDVGKVYHAFGKTAEAEEHWLRAAELEPRDTESRKLLVTAYQQEQRFEEARRVLGELVAIEPGNVIHYINLGVLSGAGGDFDASEAAFRKVQELAPRHDQGYIALAQLYLQADRKLPEARLMAQKAVELAPVAANYFLLAQAHARGGDRQQALAAIGRAIELDPGNSAYREAQARLQGETARPSPTR